jgi:hypothetical protein
MLLGGMYSYYIDERNDSTCDYGDINLNYTSKFYYTFNYGMPQKWKLGPTNSINTKCFRLMSNLNAQSVPSNLLDYTRTLAPFR